MSKGSKRKWMPKQYAFAGRGCSGTSDDLRECLLWRSNCGAGGVYVLLNEKEIEVLLQRPAPPERRGKESR